MSEVAWAAGFFDGEGCICWHRVRKYRYATLTVEQADRRPLDRFARAVGCGTIYGPIDRGPKRRPMFQYRAPQNRVVEVVALLWPFLSEPKREQALRHDIDVRYHKNKKKEEKCR